MSDRFNPEGTFKLISMVDPINVELAMSIIQLTAVLLPVLLGLTRYYVNNGEDLPDIPNLPLIRYVSFLPALLIVACISTLEIFAFHGNVPIFVSIVAYIFFFIGLLFFIPVVVADSFTRETVWSVIKGVLAAGSVVFFTVFLIMLFWFYL